MEVRTLARDSEERDIITVGISVYRPTEAYSTLDLTNVKYCNVYDEALPGNDPTSGA
jgi:hypothetical protein